MNSLLCQIDQLVLLLFQVSCRTVGTFTNRYVSSEGKESRNCTQLYRNTDQGVGPSLLYTNTDQGVGTALLHIYKHGSWGGESGLHCYITIRGQGLHCYISTLIRGVETVQCTATSELIRGQGLHSYTNSPTLIRGVGTALLYSINTDQRLGTAQHR